MLILLTIIINLNLFNLNAQEKETNKYGFKKEILQNYHNRESIRYWEKEFNYMDKDDLNKELLEIDNNIKVILENLVFLKFSSINPTIKIGLFFFGLLEAVPFISLIPYSINKNFEITPGNYHKAMSNLELSKYDLMKLENRKMETLDSQIYYDLEKYKTENKQNELKYIKTVGGLLGVLLINNQYKDYMPLTQDIYYYFSPDEYEYLTESLKLFLIKKRVLLYYLNNN